MEDRPQDGARVARQVDRGGVRVPVSLPEAKETKVVPSGGPPVRSALSPKTPMPCPLSPYFRFRLQCPVPNASPCSVPNASPCFPRRTGNSGLEELESALSPNWSPNWSLPCPQCFQTRATPMLPDAAPSPRLPDGHPCFLTPTLSVSASAKDLCIACRLRIQVGRMSRSSRSSARNRSRSRCKDACSVA